jgi:hypothetical protein
MTSVERRQPNLSITIECLVGQFLVKIPSEKERVRSQAEAAEAWKLVVSPLAKWFRSWITSIFTLFHALILDV